MSPESAFVPRWPFRVTAQGTAERGERHGSPLKTNAKQKRCGGPYGAQQRRQDGRENAAHQNRQHHQELHHAKHRLDDEADHHKQESFHRHPCAQPHGICPLLSF
ncbi:MULTISPECIES: hypothetical protein [Bradyrhizobium]|jgi:hypothetical protein|uniref:hypothetical protein n=1 Tax=Bradyrhizobium TaxID=374 RepID=UPI0011AE9E03|nr:MULTISPECIES: hypothetical protein [Bradyrhizobium]